MVNCDYGKSTNRKLDINNMLALATAGTFIKLFFSSNYSNDGSSGPATSTIWGYGLSIVSLFSLAFISLGLAKECSNSTNPMVQNIKDFLVSAGSNFMPILLLLFILIWIVAINIIYFKRINQNKIAHEYNQYSNINSILILFQLALLFQYYNNFFSNESKVELHQSIANYSSSLMYIFILLSFVLTGMMQIVLEFYSTDG